jgi:hypothetical protein
MRSSIAAGLLGAAVILTSACELDQVTFGDRTGRGAPERFEPWLTTDRLSYTAFFTPTTIEIDIGFTFVNHGRTAVAVPRCTHPYRPVLDKLIGHEWFEVFTPLEPCWDEPLVINAGRSHDFVFRVRAARPHTHGQPQFLTTRLPGTYRLRWEVYEYDVFSQFRVGRLLPIVNRVSNEFRIVH